MTAGGERIMSRSPAKLGRYDVLVRLASGGMGTVYLAKPHSGLERLVAIKVMHAHLREDPSFSAELLEEAKLAGRIEHPNVVQILDADVDDEGFFLVMDYVEGDSLAGLTKLAQERGEAVPQRVGLRILVDALEGLHAAHELRDGDQHVGVVHRDFTPQNILIGRDGLSRLTDFGVAKAVTRNSHTATGLIKGKLHYMPPEQARSDPLDRRSDVWSAGVMLWEILAGQRMYEDLNDTAVLIQLITDDPPSVRSVRPDVPEALEAVVRWALTKDLDARCPSADALAQAIERAAAESGGLADRAEVGAFVERLHGEALDERRAQVDAAIVAVGGTTPRIVAAPSPLLDEPSTFDALNASRRPEELVRKNGLRSAAALLLGIAVVVGSVETYRSLNPAPHPPTPATSAAALPSASTASVASAAPVVTSSASTDPSARIVVLVSETPMISVTVGDRWQSFRTPHRRIEVALTATEADTVESVVVRAHDHRSVEVSIAGVDEVTVEFPRVRIPPPTKSRWPTAP